MNRNFGSSPRPIALQRLYCSLRTTEPPSRIHFTTLTRICRSCPPHRFVRLLLHCWPATLSVSANGLGQHPLTFALMHIVLLSIQVGREELEHARPNPRLILSIGPCTESQGIARPCWFSLRNVVGAVLKCQ